ncbi:MAG: hypothetical protein Q8Q05_00750 [bacterium]|nr:hypothetical protein [bacterium]
MLQSRRYGKAKLLAAGAVFTTPGRLKAATEDEMFPRSFIAALVAVLVVGLSGSAFGQSVDNLGGGQNGPIPDQTGSGKVSLPTPPVAPATPPQGETVGNIVPPPPTGGDEGDRPLISPEPHPEPQTKSVASPPWETRPGIEYAAKNFFQGKNGYEVCFKTPSGQQKRLNFRYDTASQKREIKKWVSVYVDQALANPNSSLGKRLNSIDRDLANCREVLDIDPNNGRSRRLDTYDRVLEIQPNGRSKRLDNHESRIDTLERNRDGSRFGFGWLTIWLLIVTAGLVWGFFLRPRN